MVKFTVIAYDIKDFNALTCPDEDFSNILLQLNERTVWILNRPLKHGDVFYESDPYKINYYKKTYVNIDKPLLSITEPRSVSEALSFNGYNQYINLPNSFFNVWNNLSAGTVLMWIKINNFHIYNNNGFDICDAFFVKQHDNVNSYSILGVTDYQGETGDHFLKFQMINGTNVIGSTVIQTGLWYQIAATWDGSHIKIYVNGVLDASLSSGTGLVDDSEPTNIQIGGWTTSSLFTDGLIDEVNLFDAALSEFQISTLYNNGKGMAGNISLPPWSNHLLAGYHMEDATDFSGNGFDGDIFNHIEAVTSPVNRRTILD